MSPIRLRLAQAGDAEHIAGLEAALERSDRLPGPPAGAGEPGRAGEGEPARRWAERLALPAGDDHFVIVAEVTGDGVAGFAAAGGSRDDDGKGDGELYALTVDSTAEVAGALVAEVLARLTRAGYARATCWVGTGRPAADPVGCEVVRLALERLGFEPDVAHRADATGRQRLARRLGPPARS